MNRVHLLTCLLLMVAWVPSAVAQEASPRNLLRGEAHRDVSLHAAPFLPRSPAPLVSRDTISYFGESAFFAELPGDPNDPNRSNIAEYATRFTAPRNGTLLSIIFWINGRAESLQGTGTLRIHYRLADAQMNQPGSRVSFVDVPFSALRAGEGNAVDLENLDITLGQDEEFYVSFEVIDGSPDARIEFLIDAGSQDQNDPNFFPARSFIFLDTSSEWVRWQDNSNFLFAAVVGNKNNTADEATPITFDLPTIGSGIAPAGDVDYYSFEAEAGDVVRIETMNTPGSNLDGRLWLYDSDGNELADNDDFQGTERSRIRYAFREAGTYFLRHAYLTNEDDFPNKRGASGNAPTAQRITDVALSAASKGVSSDARKDAAGVQQTGNYVLLITTIPLPAPLGVQAGDRLDNVVGLSWQQPINGDLRYNVYRSTSQSGPFSQIATAQIQLFVDTDVQNGTTYYYQLTTYIEEGNVESTQTATVSATPDRDTYRVISPLASTVPTIDGTFSAGEWSDATQIDITSPFEDGAPVTMWLKNDDQFFYVAVEDLNGSIDQFDQIGLYFDDDHNGTWDPSPPSSEGNFWIDDDDDPIRIQFRSLYGSFPNVFEEAVTRDPAGVDAALSENSSRIQYEVRIDLTQGAFQASPGSTIGFWVFSSTGPFTGRWPAGTVFLAPVTFAQVTLGSANPPPTVVNAIQDQPNLAAGGAAFEVDLNTVFNDPEGESLSYAASSNNASVATASVSGATLRVSPQAAGTATITVMASDPAGGTVTDRFDVTVVANTPPIIAHTPVTRGTDGEALTITAMITDDLGIASARVRYAQGGSSTTNEVTMTASGTTYQANIPVSAVTSRGLSYEIVVEDTGGLEVIDDRVHVRVEVQDLERAVSSSGSSEGAYRLISVPLDLSDKNASSILPDDFGAYNPEVWRFYGLNANQSYDEFPNGAARTIPPGRAFFLLVRDGGQTWTTGPGLTVSTGQAFFVDLNPGWTFVGTPFNFSVLPAFYRLESDPGGTPDVRAYNGSWSSQSGALQPFIGYAIASQGNDRLVILPNAELGEAAHKREDDQPTLAAFDWSIRILAEARGTRDEDNVAAVTADASMTLDSFDRPEPPVIGTFVSVSFPHPEWETPFYSYSTDARPMPAQRTAWPLEVRTNVDDPVTLRFEDLAQVPEAFEVWLVDETTRAWHNLRQTPRYTVAGASEETPRRLTLLVGRHEALTDPDLATTEVPERFELHNFPNPFNPATTIRYGLPEPAQVSLTIYNLLGGKVATLVDQEEQPAGYHAVTWSGRGSAGQPVASGVYYYVLHTDEHVLTGSMVLAK